MEERENTEDLIVDGEVDKGLGKDYVEKPGLSKSAKVILGCTIALFLFMSASMFFMFTYLHDLTASPFQIGAEKTAQSSGADDVYCSCTLVGLADKNLYPYKDQTFAFNTSGIVQREKTYNSNLNVSQINQFAK